MKKLVLQRQFFGQDGWDAFCEQISIDEDHNLYYRISEPGNTVRGEWLDWEGEDKVFEFMFGDLPFSQNLIDEFRKACIKAPEIKEDTINFGFYQK